MKRNGIILTGAAAAAAAQADAAAKKEAQRVAGAVETSVLSLLGRLVDSCPSEHQEDAILAGAIYALVRFTFQRCWARKVPTLSHELLRRWAPMMRDAVVMANAMKPPADQGDTP